MGTYYVRNERGKRIDFVDDWEHASLAVRLGFDLTTIPEPGETCPACDLEVSGAYNAFNVKDGEQVCPGCDYPRNGTDWTTKRKPRTEPCRHKGSGGERDCKACGAEAMDFILAAQSWLDDHVGEDFEDPGYFDD